MGEFRQKIRVGQQFGGGYPLVGEYKGHRSAGGAQTGCLIAVLAEEAGGLSHVHEVHRRLAAVRGSEHILLGEAGIKLIAPPGLEVQGGGQHRQGLSPGGQYLAVGADKAFCLLRYPLRDGAVRLAGTHGDPEGTGIIVLRQPLQGVLVEA